MSSRTVVMEMLEQETAPVLIRVELLKDAILPQEVKFLNPNIWRHGWANWALEHPDSNVAKLGAKTMGHSETTRDAL